MARRHDYPKPETTALRKRVVKLFNAGKTLTEIGDKLGMPRGTAGRFISEARALGIPTVHYTPSETSQRQQASMRAKAIAIATRKIRANESPRPGTPPE